MQATVAVSQLLVLGFNLGYSVKQILQRQRKIKEQQIIMEHECTAE
jgi:hypothetical protein